MLHNRWLHEPGAQYTINTQVHPSTANTQPGEPVPPTTQIVMINTPPTSLKANKSSTLHRWTLLSTPTLQPQLYNQLLELLPLPQPLRKKPHITPNLLLEAPFLRGIMKDKILQP
jgi:hypothetical protein